ncbi:hypothetical protein SDJN02_13131, partial [Cucurbita argyrosperma subsp. argyrosperma]
MFFFYSPFVFQPLFFIESMTPRSPLRQLLQEQQEPFELEDYLFEREWYSRKSSNRGSGFGCSGGKLNGVMKFGKGFVEINKMLRNSCKKLLSIHRKQQQTKDVGENGWFFSVGCKRVAESDNFLSPCSFQTTLSSDNEQTSPYPANSSSSDTSGALEPCNLQVLKDMKTGKKSLIRARPNNGIPLQKQVSEDSILSATLLQLLLCSAATEKTSGTETAELQELVTSSPATQLMIPKRVIHQTKQLLFDCVREVVATHSKKGSRKARRLICAKEAKGKEANLSNLVCSDYLFSAEEWRDFKPQKQLIGTEIGEFIVQEIINEAVTELIDNLWPSTLWLQLYQDSNA